MWIYCNGDEFSETYRCEKCGHRLEINLEISREDLPEMCPKCGFEGTRKPEMILEGVSKEG
mgnify:CR=1 FL=1